MGFLGSLLGGAVKIARSIFGGAAPVAAPAAAGTRAGLTSKVADLLAKANARARAVAATRTAQLAAAGGVGLGTGLLVARGGAAADTTATTAAALAAQGVMGGVLGRGNGQFVKQTIVQTIELATGTVVRQETFAGAPFAMQKEINRIRTLDKKLTKAAARIRSKGKGPSKTKQLTDAVVDSALRNVVAGCPPKC